MQNKSRMSWAQFVNFGVRLLSISLLRKSKHYWHWHMNEHSISVSYEILVSW